MACITLRCLYRMTCPMQSVNPAIGGFSTTSAVQKVNEVGTPSFYSATSILILSFSVMGPFL